LIKERQAQLEGTKARMQGSIDRLTEAGHGELAEMIRKTVAFSQQLLQSMVDMKIQMYHDTKTGEDAVGENKKTNDAYMAMRQKLLDANKSSQNKNAELEEKLKEELAKFGIKGAAASEHLAMFLNQLTFQLATGEQNGFDKLLGNMFDTFGVSLEGVEGIDEMMGGAMRALAMKQKSIRDILGAVSASYGQANSKFKSLRNRVNSQLSDEQQLANVSDEDLRNHIRHIKKMMQNIKTKEGPVEQPLGVAKMLGGALVEEGEGNELEKRQQSLSELVQRAHAERQNRAEAVKEQQEIYKRLSAALECFQTLKAAHANSV